MKRFYYHCILLSSIFCLLFMALSINSAAQSKSLFLLFYQHSLSDTEHRIDPAERGNRSLDAPITCIITLEEMSISGIDSASIFYYEIYDESGQKVASFSHQKEFTYFIFNSSGSFIIRLVLKDFALVGYIDT